MNAISPCLVLLDNAEDITDCDPLAQLIAATPEVRWLVTSRITLALPHATHIALGPLSDDEAAILVRERLVEASGSADNNVISAIVAQVGGWPLALELVARRARFGLDTITSSATRMGVSEVLEWSWEHLVPGHRPHLGGLTVFQGAFDLDDVLAVLPETDFDILERLESWLDVGWLSLDDGRFGFLPPVRRFLTQQTNEPMPTERRHAEHMAALCSQSAIDNPMAPRIRDVQAAAEWATQHAAVLAGSLLRVLFRHPVHVEQTLCWAQDALLQGAGDGEDWLRFLVMKHGGALENEALKAIQSTTADPILEASCWSMRFVLCVPHDMGRAKQLMSTAPTGDAYTQFVVLRRRIQMEGLPTEEHRLCLQAYELAKSTGFSPWLRPLGVRLLAQSYVALGDLDQATQVFRELLMLDPLTDSERLMALAALARIHGWQNQTSEIGILAGAIEDLLPFVSAPVQVDGLRKLADALKWSDPKRSQQLGAQALAIAQNEDLLLQRLAEGACMGSAMACGERTEALSFVEGQLEVAEQITSLSPWLLSPGQRCWPGPRTPEHRRSWSGPRKG